MSKIPKMGEYFPDLGESLVLTNILWAYTKK